MFYKITADEFRNNLQKRIDESSAELMALDAVTINTTHKTLTNRSVSGYGARIGDYIGIGKALFVSYEIKHADGHTRYAQRDITAYTYYDENGKELGSEGMMRISRTMTPVELNNVLQDVIAGITKSLDDMKSEYDRADEIIEKRDQLIDQLNKFNDGISYASKGQIQ